MTYADAERQLFSLPRFADAGASAYQPGLERMRSLLGAMGDPHLVVPSVHVAGTNGKGSTASMIAAIATASGLKTGLHTSPHLLTLRERMRIDGAPASEDWVADAMTRFGEAIESHGPSFFEATVALSFLYFAEAGAELSVVEVGLGGRLDATNVLEPLVAVVTHVGLDHTDLLGDTLAAIAREKAGIAKPGVPLVHALAPGEARDALEDEAKRRGAPVEAVGDSMVFDLLGPEHETAPSEQAVGRAQRLPSRTGGGQGVGDRSSSTPHSSRHDAGGGATGRPRLVPGPAVSPPPGREGTGAGDREGGTSRHHHEPIRLDLPGTHQRSNAALAVRAASLVIPGLTAAAIRTGLENTVRLAGLRGRAEIVAPGIIADVAHNADGWRAALASAQPGPGGRLFVAVGLMADKDLRSLVELLASSGATVFPLALDGDRSLPRADLTNALRGAGVHVEKVNDLSAALVAFESARRPGDCLLVTGSHVAVADLLTTLKSKRTTSHGERR